MNVNALDIVNISLFSLGVVVLTVLVELVLTRVKLIKTIKKLYVDIVIGLLFLGYNILMISFAVQSHNPEVPMIFTTCLIPVVVTGLLFDWPALIVVGLGSFFYRAFYLFPSVDYLRWPSSISIAIIAIAVFLLKRFIFTDKNSSKLNWIYGFFVGFFAETVRMFFILIGNMRRVNTIYTYIVAYDIASILVTGVIVALCVLMVLLFNHVSIKAKIFHDDRLSAKVQKRIFIAVIISFIASFALTSEITRGKTRRDSMYSVVTEANDIAYVITIAEHEQDIQLVAKRRHVQIYGLSVVINADTNIVISILDDESLIQYLNKQMPDFASGKHLTDYNPIDPNDPKATTDNRERYVFFDNIAGVDCMFSWSQSAATFGNHQKYNILSLLPTQEINTNYGVSVRTSIYLQIIIFSILYLIIVHFVERKVLYNIKSINNSLEQIMDGNLDTQVNAKGSKEFITLSDNINLTVGALKNYSDEIGRRLAEETELAADIQKNSVITVFPNERNFDVYATMRTAKEVGGDFYDYVKINDDKVVFLIADVVGNGIVSAMYMIRAKTLIKSLLVEDEKTKDIDIVSVMDKVNKELNRGNTMSVGMSMWIGVLDTKANTLKYINANHEVPLVCLDDEIYKPLPCKKNVYLGLDPNYVYETETITFAPGSEIILYLDGIVNLKNTKGEKYGLDSLVKLCNETQYFTAKQLIQNVNDDLDRFAKDVPDLETDLTTFCLIYSGEVEKKPEHEITLKAIPNNTPIATKFVESIMQQYNCSQKSQAIMLIAVDELFSNIAYYAYKGKPGGGNGTIRIEIKGQEFKMQLIDSGTPFNPLAHLDPNYINSSAEERTNKGGLGIFMVRRSVDDMQYVYENGQNILTIIKTIPEMHEEEFKDSFSTTRD